MDNAPKEAPKEQDVSYSVMPNMAKRAMTEPVPEPAKPKHSPLSSAMNPMPAAGRFRLSRRTMYVAGAVVLLSMLGILAYAMVQKNKERNRGPVVLQTKLPKVWLSQNFGTEGCTDANVCADDADPDADGLTNYNEFKEGTNPRTNDSDSDGLADGDEVNIFKTDPGLKYTDRRDVAAVNDYNDAVSIANEYDPLTPGIKMTPSRLQQIADDTAKFRLHEPTLTTLGNLKTPGAAAQTLSVFIENNQFNPEKTVINKGDTVVWLNKDMAQHQVYYFASSNFGGFQSPKLETNQTYSHTFELTGTFQYEDQLNSQVKGTVEVK